MKRREGGLAERVVALLGRYPCPDAVLAEGLELLKEVRDVSVLDRAVFRNKVPRLFAKALARLALLPAAKTPPVEKVVSHFSPLLRRIGRQQADLTGSFQTVITALAEAGVPFLPIKGAAFRLLFPDYVERDLNDLDLLLARVEDLWKAGAVLRGLGYRVDPEQSARIINVAPVGSRPEWIGQMLLRQAENGLKVDLHAGGIGFARASAFGRDALSRAVTVEPGRVQAPCREDALLVILAHAAGHTYLTRKDLNDVAVLLSSPGGLDFGQAWSAARECGLAGVMAYALNKVSQEYGLQCPAPPLSGPERAVCRALSRCRPHNNAQFRWSSWWLDILLAYDRERRPGGAGAVRGAVAQAWSHYMHRRVNAGLSAPLEWLLRALRPASCLFPSPPRGRIVGLLQVSEEAAPGLGTEEWPEAGCRAMRAGRAEVLLNRFGAWLPTVCFVVSDDDLDEAARLLRALKVAPESRRADPDGATQTPAVPVNYETINPARARGLAERFLNVTDHARRPVSRSEIAITNRCNLKCSYCQRRIPEDEPEASLPPSAWEANLNVWAARGCRFVHFTGGEPTLYSGLDRLVAAARTLGMTVSLTTNGTAAPELYTDLVRKGLRSVHLSLDHYKEGTVDSTVGVRGTFGRVIETMRILTTERDRRCPDLHITLNTCVLPKELGELPRLLRFLLDLAPDDVKLMPIAQLHDRWQTRLGDYERMLPELRAMLPETGFAMLRARLPVLLSPSIRGLVGREPDRCYLIREERCVDPAGDYYRCYIHMREGGRAVGNLTSDPPDVQAAKLARISERPTRDPICRTFCADICATCNLYCDHLVRAAVAQTEAATGGLTTGKTKAPTGSVD